jgi:hypothetical protein
VKTLSTRIIKELGEALKMFGSYTFDDKGPDEVMDIGGLVEELKKLTSNEASEVLFEVARAKNHKGRGLQVAMYLVLDLQDWDELFTISGIDDLLNGNLPKRLNK